MHEKIRAMDAWLLKQHQHLADRIYSILDTSPYLIAAQMFAFTCLLGIAYYGISFSIGQREVSPLPIMAVFGILFMGGAWHAVALIRHKSWKRSKQPQPEHPMDCTMRIIWLAVVISVVPQHVVIAFTAGPFLLEMADILRSVVTWSAFYFVACQPPSFIERKKLVFASEAA